MVRAAAQNPGLRCGGQRRLGAPQGARDRQLRQRLRLLNRIHHVHQQAETVAHIDYAGVDRAAGWGREDQARRIGFAADAEELHVDQRLLLFGDRGADFQHMRA